MLSTKEAAAICKVALSTIVYWFDKGLIKGYRTPGGHRRIFRADLETFMRAHDMPVGHRLDSSHFRVLVAGPDEDLLGELTRELERLADRVEWASARSGLAAGRLVSSFRPDLLVVDLELPGIDGADLCRTLRQDPETEAMDLVFLARPERGGVSAQLRAAGARAVLDRPPFGEPVRKLLTERLERN